MRATLIGLAGLWLLNAAPAMAEIYKCRLPGGKTEISNAPCPRGSETLTARPDETVPEANRQQAERDVERMRNFVDKREASQRAESEAERQASRPAASGQPTARRYGDAAACLDQLRQQVLEAGQRAALEAECRSLQPAPEAAPTPGYGPLYVPAYGHPPPPRPAYPRQTPDTPRPAPPSGPPVTLCPPASKNCQR